MGQYFQTGMHVRNFWGNAKKCIDLGSTTNLLNKHLEFMMKMSVYYS